MASLWEAVRDWVARSGEHHLYVPIPAERCQPAPPGAPLVPGQSYFRLWLAELFLARGSGWGREWLPAASAEVKLRYGDEEATFTRVARPPEGALGDGVRLNYALTELLPWNGGTVEVEAALLALEASDQLGATLELLRKVSQLAGPPVAQAVQLASTVSLGLRDLLAAGGGVRLGLHQTFTSPDGAGVQDLRAGYLAVVAATAAELPSEQLHVVDGRLHRAAPGQPPHPVDGHDYLLLRVEGREERDDWRYFADLDDLLMEARASYLEGNQERGDAYRTVALATALRSPALTTAGRTSAAAAITTELSEAAKRGQGAAGMPARHLDEVMAAHALPAAHAAALGQLSEAEVLRGWWG